MKDLGYGSEEKSIKTVLVFKDPSDWYVDLQVITDICVGGQSSITHAQSLLMYGQAAIP